MKVPISSIKVDARKRRLDDQKVRELADSILAMGLLQPIGITEDNWLVFGLHRLEACRRLGWKEIDAVVVGDGDVLRAELAEIDENLVRVELTALEYAERLARAQEIYEALHPDATQDHPKKQRLNRTKAPCGAVSPGFMSDVSAKTGLPFGTIQRYLQIATGIPEDIRDAIRSTHLARNKRELLKLSRLSESEQRAVVKLIVDGEAKEVNKALHVIRQQELRRLAEQLPPDERYQLICGDFAEECAKLAESSIDVIITDPPYPKEYLDLFGKLAEIANRVLKPGGSLVTLVPHIWLPQILEQMSKHLDFHWVLAYHQPGATARIWGSRVIVGWKPILWFVKGKYDGDFVYDVVTSTERDKEFHRWGQSEGGMRELVERFTKPGETVLDPFVGGGSVAVAAVGTGRKFIGIDIDERSIATTQVRLVERLHGQSIRQPVGSGSLDSLTS